MQVRKGLLEFCILNALGDRRLYGYDIVKRLRAVDGLVIGEGTIYPILSRFRSQGLVEASVEESPEGPPRKYYRLTELGERLAGAAVPSMRQLLRLPGQPPWREAATIVSWAVASRMVLSLVSLLVLLVLVVLAALSALPTRLAAPRRQ